MALTQNLTRNNLDAGILLASLLLILSVLPSHRLAAQRGPGGVSTETPGQSTCRLWLDASQLSTLADGDNVNQWSDVSPSAETENADMGNSATPPIFRDDPAYSMNGHPVITFGEGRYFELSTSADLNLSEIAKSKTVFFAFRTSTDVQSLQCVYEEGGPWRGFNIYITNGKIKVGVYDWNSNPACVNNDAGYCSGGEPDSDDTPPWGYAYVEHIIQPNTTYVLSAQFSAATEGMVAKNDNFFLRAFLNGSDFSSIDYDFDLVHGNGNVDEGVGTLGLHEDPPGLGAVNTKWLTAESTSPWQDVITGEEPFTGLMAEMIYYNDLLTPTQRIIIENYMGAKYLANLNTNDRYDYQVEYGNGLIGVGRFTDQPAPAALNVRDSDHNESKGNTPFTISKVSPYTNNNVFFLMGHNNGSMSYTASDVPNKPSNTRRLSRTWRADETGSMGPINFTIHEDDLPELPSGFSEYVLIVDETSPNFPNFNLGTTRVLGLTNNGDGTHSIELDMADGAFFTVGVIKPEINFNSSSPYALESNPPPDSTEFAGLIHVKLNYTIPVISPNEVTADYRFEDGNATLAEDYWYDSSEVDNGVAIPPGSNQASIPVFIQNDTIAESLDSLIVILENGPQTTAGLNIGASDSLNFYIYDDDPPPKVSFSASSSAVSEDTGNDTLTLVRSGSTEGSHTVRVEQTGGDASTADFTYSPGYHEYTFTDGQNQIDIPIPIVNDNIDEYQETIEFQVSPAGEIGAENPLVHTTTIIDEDPEPVAQFESANGEGFEATGEPLINITLDRPSAKNVEVDYSINTDLSSATASDYDMAYTGTIAFPMLDTLQSLPLTILNNDVSPEADEDLIIDLPSAINATVSGQTQYTYTILDFEAYNWKGVAGIGRRADNIVWINADDENGNQGDEIQSPSNFSPRNINIAQSSASNRAELQVTGDLINNRQTYKFEDDDYYIVENSGLINEAGSSTRMSFFMVIQTGDNVDDLQMLYEQGGALRGLSIYIRNAHIYFNAWNLDDQGGDTPWGYGPNNTNTNDKRYAKSQTISADSTYIVSCHFDKNAPKPLKIFTNGKAGIQEDQDCGTLYSHVGPIGLGGVADNTLVDNSSSKIETLSTFHGLISEFILFHHPLMNEARRVILENYLSGKYNIALGDSDTPQIFDLSYAEKSNNGYFGYDIAGVGQAGSTQEVHLKSQGPASQSQLLVKTSLASLQDNTYMVWGHNEVPFDNTWPYSSSGLPGDIEERSGRVWRFFKGGDAMMGNVDVLISLADLANAADFDANNIKLLLHTNADAQDFSNATVYEGSFNSGYVAEFSDIFIPTGAYVTIANTNLATPLPIELLAFRVRLNSTNSTVDLNWATATETHNDYFVVECAGKDLRFKKVLEKPGGGSTTQAQYYSAVDGQPLTGINYYRLKQVDFDGGTTYSDVQSVYVPGGTISDDVFLYPNPYLSGELNIRYPNSGGEKTIRILDMSGKVIYNRSFDSEGNLIKIDPGDLTPGVYTVSFRNKLIEASNKLIVR